MKTKKQKILDICDEQITEIARFIRKSEEFKLQHLMFNPELIRKFLRDQKKAVYEIRRKSL